MRLDEACAKILPLKKGGFLRVSEKIKRYGENIFHDFKKKLDPQSEKIC